MSTPTASLKKTRRSPLPTRGLPFRKDNPLPSLSPLKEGASLNPSDHTSHRHILEGIRNEGRVPKDADLVTSMATRLATVERELLAAKREIIEKVIYLICVHLSIYPSVQDHCLSICLLFIKLSIYHLILLFAGQLYKEVRGETIFFANNINTRTIRAAMSGFTTSS